MGFEVIIWLLFLSGWALGWLLLGPDQRCSSRSDCGPAGAVSIIIPARNEALNLPRLLRSLQAETGPSDEVLVIDDGSTDGTGEIAAGFGARVILSAELPDGWTGKAWACQQGAEAADSEMLLFLDADTWLELGGLQQLHAIYRKTGGALSLAAFHYTEKAYEQLSAFFNWVMTAGCGAFTPAHQACGMFGPCLMVSRADYHRAGGHAAVKNRVLENLYLAREFRRAGLPVTCRYGRGILGIRMYAGGVRALCQGWGKAFVSGAQRTPSILMAGIVLWLSSAAAAAMMLAVSVCGGGSRALWGGLYALFVLQVFVQLRRVGRFFKVTALLYPIPLFFFFGVFAAACFQKEVCWKDRICPAE